MPLPTLSFTVNAMGISAPSYADILQSLQESFQAIYGSDAYISPDSQDGQWLAVIAQAINDQNQNAIALWNSFSPTFAQGAGLSSLVKINGITRQLPSFSTAVGNVVGTPGTVINNGSVIDANGNIWDLPSSVTIPGPGGSISVTVTAEQPGALIAPSGSINQINTPTLGWQSFVSTADAVPGAPVETDAQLRQRQAAAAELPSVTPLGGLLAALAALPGVLEVAVYENTGTVPDANGLPAKSISVVINGGNLVQIAKTIGQKKTPGAATYGTTSQSYIDPVTLIPYVINFFLLTNTVVNVALTIRTFAGWSSLVQTEIQNAITAYINGLAVGQPVQLSRVYIPAYLNGASDGNTYEITALTLNTVAADVAIAFNKSAQMGTFSVTIVP